MRWLILILIVGLAGCNTPTPQFYGVTPISVTVEGSTYKVFRAEDRAQAIRITPDMRQNFRAEERITYAIEIATGCEVVGALKGDVVLADARVDCGAGARPWPVDLHIEFYCDVEDYGSGQVYCTEY